MAKTVSNLECLIGKISDVSAVTKQPEEVHPGMDLDRKGICSGCQRGDLEEFPKNPWLKMTLGPENCIVECNLQSIRKE